MNVFVKSTLTRPLEISVSDLDANLSEKFQRILQRELEGKCTAEGYIKKGSIVISKHSVGILKDHLVCFTVDFLADVVYPVKDQLLHCVVVGPNHFGLNCALKDDDGSNSCDVYIPRDHHHPAARLNKYAPGSDIDVKVSGTRFEVNGSQITVIGYIHDDVVETSDVGESLWTVEYVDDVTLRDAQDHPDKTYVVDSSLIKTKKELAALKKMANVRVLDVAAFASFHTNKEMIQPFIESLHDAKTIVFPYEFADSVRASEETYTYLKSKLTELGFQPVREKQTGGKAKEMEEDVMGDY